MDEVMDVMLAYAESRYAKDPLFRNAVEHGVSAALVKYRISGSDYANAKVAIRTACMISLIRKEDTLEMRDTLENTRNQAVAISGATDNIYLGDCVRDWARVLHEEQELTRQQMAESLAHGKEALAFQKALFEREA